MSEENVEIVRRYFESAPNPEGADRFWEVDGDYYPVRKFPEARPLHGREEIVRFLAEFTTAWATGGYRNVIKNAYGVSDDRVLVHAHLSAQGRSSGMALEGDLYYCLWLRNGRFFRQEDHLTAKGALRALGLKGETLKAAGLSE
jgi:hypothetical protein